MGLSFPEKSLWLQLVGLVAVFGVYFATVLPATTTDVTPSQIALFVLVVVALATLQAAGHIAIAIADRRTDTDERDRIIALKGTRNAAYVLATGVFFSLCAALVIDGNFAFMHILLGSWVLAELVGIASQLMMYRRGA